MQLMFVLERNENLFIYPFLPEAVLEIVYVLILPVAHQLEQTVWHEAVVHHQGEVDAEAAARLDETDPK